MFYLNWLLAGNGKEGLFGWECVFYFNWIEFIYKYLLLDEGSASNE